MDYFSPWLEKNLFGTLKWAAGLGLFQVTYPTVVMVIVPQYSASNTLTKVPDSSSM